MSPEPPSEQMASIAEQVHRAREALAWTQADLAAQAGVSRPSIARVERGDNVSTSTLTMVAQALGLVLAILPSDDSDDPVT